MSVRLEIVASDVLARVVCGAEPSLPQVLKFWMQMFEETAAGILRGWIAWATCLHWYLVLFFFFFPENMGTFQGNLPVFIQEKCAVCSVFEQVKGICQLYKAI